MKSARVFGVVFGLSVLCACNRQADIELHIGHGENRTLGFFEIEAETGARLVDSVRLDKNGKAALRLPPNGQGLYVLREPASGQTLVLLANKADKAKKTDRIFLTADFDSLVQSSCISPDNAYTRPAVLALDYQKLHRQSLKQLQDVNERWLQNRYTEPNTDSLYKACIREADSVRSRLKAAAYRYCRENPQTLLPVLVVNLPLQNQNLFEPDKREDLDFLLDCARKMRESQSENPHTERFLLNLEKIESAQKQQALSEWKRPDK